MATIGKITLANSGTSAISYALGKNKLEDKTKDWLLENGVDPELVSSLNDRAVAMDGINVDPEYAKTQMKATRNAFNTKGKEAVRVIQSFPDNDLSALDPNDWQKANQLGMELAQKAFPDYQVAVYTQLDGDGHKLHNHLVVNMPNLITGKKYHEHQDWEKLAKINDEIAMEHGLSVINNRDQLDYDNKIEPKLLEKRTMAELKRANKGEYVWKDDLRSKIDKVMQSDISDFKTFSDRLAKFNIVPYVRGKELSYEFLDQEKNQRRSRGSKLGADYTKEVILNELEYRHSTTTRSIGDQTIKRVIETGTDEKSRTTRTNRQRIIDCDTQQQNIDQQQRDHEQTYQQISANQRKLKQRLSEFTERIRTTTIRIKETIKDRLDQLNKPSAAEIFKAKLNHDHQIIQAEKLAKQKHLNNQPIIQAHHERGIER